MSKKFLRNFLAVGRWPLAVSKTWLIGEVVMGNAVLLEVTNG